MPIIKNATTDGQPLEAEKQGGPPPAQGGYPPPQNQNPPPALQGGPPRNWADNAPPPPPTGQQPQPQQVPPQQQPPQQQPQEQQGEPQEQTETSMEEWFGDLLTRAISSRASDIHFEPEREKFAIRIRIDGLLHEFESLSFDYQEMVISRIKVLGQMDITKRRLPQDGGFEFPYQKHIYNIRVSTYPTIYGESAVLRILDREGSLLQLKDLGFNQTQLDVMDALIRRPYGMILITGPSGSGKTTLLYSILNILNTTQNNIMTIEDPVEVHMEHVRQAQTNRLQEFNFSAALRAVLRQDPDIVMVGEIRDKETAQISIQAALTGKLIFSTFHTLDVFAVVTRMIEMEIPRSVVAHTIEGVVSSRLVRKICPHCKVAYQPTPEEKKLFGPQLDNIKELYKGKGCNECGTTGYYGRIGIFEVVAFDDDIRLAILGSASSAELLSLLKEKKIKRLSEAALDAVATGVTTLEEVMRVTGRPM